MFRGIKFVLVITLITVGETAEDRAALPSFNESTPQNVTLYQGETARLLCHVYNLQNKKVTWQKKGQHYPLTVSTFSFLSDRSIRIEHDEDSEWNLIIEKVQRNDTGIYQCKVATKTALLVREVHLTVKGEICLILLDL
ncbi:hypothetical protein EB796_024640 [Bugula neritina]|uniref:Ig-like domain-containing protein n=1 Tax=Bugula neritina TaxID=10212 RepID=A0A7J7IUG7_BUGNE|nr:hypothetical protein EB796_024640 [Bugula neritina]